MKKTPLCEEMLFPLSGACQFKQSHPIQPNTPHAYLGFIAQSCAFLVKSPPVEKTLKGNPVYCTISTFLFQGTTKPQHSHFTQCHHHLGFIAQPCSFSLEHPSVRLKEPLRGNQVYRAVRTLLFLMPTPARLWLGFIVWFRLFFPLAVCDLYLRIHG